MAGPVFAYLGLPFLVPEICTRVTIARQNWLLVCRGKVSERQKLASSNYSPPRTGRSVEPDDDRVQLAVHLGLVALLRADQHGQRLQGLLGLDLLRLLPRTGRDLAVRIVIDFTLVLGHSLLVSGTVSFFRLPRTGSPYCSKFHSGSCWFLGGVPCFTA